jgi:hypothetical protein
MSLDYFRARPGGSYPWFVLPKPSCPEPAEPAAKSRDPEELARRREKLERLVSSAAEEILEHDHGYSIRLRGDREGQQAAAEFLVAERERYPSVRFELTMEPGPGPVWLRLEGGSEAKEAIRAVLSGPGL